MNSPFSKGINWSEICDVVDGSDDDDDDDDDGGGGGGSGDDDDDEAVGLIRESMKFVGIRMTDPSCQKETNMPSMIRSLNVALCHLFLYITWILSPLRYRIEFPLNWDISFLSEGEGDVGEEEEAATATFLQGGGLFFMTAAELAALLLLLLALLLLLLVMVFRFLSTLATFLVTAA
jgi:hypothetical protein